MAKQTSKPELKKLETLTVTRTTVSTLVAYGLIGVAAMSGFFFFMSRLSATSAENESATNTVQVQPTIEQQTGTALKLQVASTGQPAATTAAKVRQTLTARKAKLLKLFTTDPERAARNILSVEARALFTTADQALIEQTVSLKGTYRPQVAEFGNGETQTWHRLQLADESVRFLHFSGPALDLKPGSTVTIAQAYALDADVLVPGDLGDGSTNVTMTDVAAALPTTNRKTAVILYNFSDDTRQPMTTDQVRSAIFTASNSVDAYYKETTFNSTRFVGKNRTDGDVLGWYTISSTYPKTPSDCAGNAVDTWAAQARQLAQAAGNDLSGYDHYLYIMPWLLNQWDACYWAGLADIGGNQAWIHGAPNYVNVRIVGHELGHNLGLWHAQTRRCRDGSGATVSLSTSCTDTGYADVFDVMGNYGPAQRQFSTFNKNKLGIYTSGNVVDVTANGTFTLAPIEQPSTGVQALRISRGTNQQPLYVEFRQPFGTFDNFSATDPAVNGVMVRLGPAAGVTAAYTYLLDMTPATSDTPGTTDGFFDAALPASQTFQDFASGVIVKTISVGSTGAVVEVQFVPPTCQHSAPVVNFLPPSQTSAPGATKTFNFTVASTETSICPTVTYNLSGLLPPGWSQVVTPSSLTLTPGGSGQFTVAVSNPLDSAMGTYAVSESLIDAATNVTVLTKTATMSLIPSENTPPTVTITKPLDGATLPSKGKQSVSVTASDASGLTSISIKIDNLYVKTCGLATSCTYSWTMGKGVTSGSHTITAIATDASPAQNQATKTITVRK